MTLIFKCYGASRNYSVVNKPQDNRNCKIAVKDTDSNVCLGTNESAISEFNNALRISYVTLK